jgi:hypothetical protein
MQVQHITMFSGSARFRLPKLVQWNRYNLSRTAVSGHSGAFLSVHDVLYRYPSIALVTTCACRHTHYQVTPHKYTTDIIPENMSKTRWHLLPPKVLFYLLSILKLGMRISTGPWLGKMTFWMSHRRHMTCVSPVPDCDITSHIASFWRYHSRLSVKYADASVVYHKYVWTANDVNVVLAFIGLHTRIKLWPGCITITTPEVNWGQFGVILCKYGMEITKEITQEITLEIT